MRRPSVKRVLGLGVLAGIVYTLWRAWQKRMPAPSGDMQWEAAPFPFPPVPRPPAATAPSASAPVVAAVAAAWIDPDEDGSCPASHPVKAKLKSGIFHEPEGVNYRRTKADRCYVDGDAAVADGLRKSKA